MSIPKINFSCCSRPQQPKTPEPKPDPVPQKMDPEVQAIVAYRSSALCCEGNDSSGDEDSTRGTKV